MAKKTYKVTKVNPAKKKKPVAKKKKTAKKKAAKKRPAKKKKTSTKTNPTRKKKTVAKKKKKKGGRRRKRPATRKAAPRRTRSRSNPKMSIDVKRPFTNFLPRTLGQMVTAAVVYKFGDAPSGNWSATAGAQWSMKNYFIGYITSLVGGEVLARFGGKKAWGQGFYDGGVELMATKAVWTEVIGRVPALKAYLGAGEGNSDFAALAAQAQEGDIIEDSNGTTWLLQNGQWVSMQGADPYKPRQLADGDPYAPKELDGVLTDEDYLGGVLTDEDYLGRMRQVTPMGHAMQDDAGRTLINRAAYQDTGSDDPFRTLYQQ